MFIANLVINQLEGINKVQNNFKTSQIKIKCKECNSNNMKKRKNFSHGSNSKAKVTYICKDCNSTNVEIETGRRSNRR